VLLSNESDGPLLLRAAQWNHKVESLSFGRGAVTIAARQVCVPVGLVRLNSGPVWGAVRLAAIPFLRARDFVRKAARGRRTGA